MFFSTKLRALADLNYILDHDTRVSNSAFNGCFGLDGKVAHECTDSICGSTCILADFADFISKSMAAAKRMTEIVQPVAMPVSNLYQLVA